MLWTTLSLQLEVNPCIRVKVKEEPSMIFSLLSLHSGYFFIDGPGGSGKTYLRNTLYNIPAGEMRRVVCFAWAGIAAK